MRYILILLVWILSFDQGKTEKLDVCTSCSYQGLQSAIQAASAGDTILVHDGSYFEYGIVVDKPLVIMGSRQAIIDGQNKGEILTIISDHVEIRGLTVQNVGTSYLKDQAAIRIKQSRDFIIQEVKLYNSFFGVYLENSKDGIVTNNEIIGEAEQEISSGNGIHVWYCDRIQISDNLITHHRDGIYLEFVDNSLVDGNRSVENLRYGLHFMFSNDNAYQGNLFRDNGAGVAVMFSKNIKMTKNTFLENWGTSSYGLLLKEIYDADITGNTFEKNTIGIYVEGSTRINYTGNDFKGNGWGIKITGGCLDNHVSANNFMSNSMDLVLYSQVNNNTFHGNYWSAYTGYDLDRDNIGDVPYRPVKLFSHVLDKVPEAIILLRSFIIDLLNFTEKVNPAFTPKNVVDDRPLMKPATS